MEKEHNLHNTKQNSENTNTQSIGPSTDDLKQRFKEGSIPLQTDYADLINIADIGRKACGQAPQQNGPGKGLKLDDDGTLNLKMGTLSNQDFSPLILKDNILSVDLGSGLINKTNGICVGQGNGIVVNGDNVAVKAANGVIVDDNGVAVKFGNGINVDTNGVSVKVKDKDKTINVESTGISVRLGLGVTKGDGINVKASNGINVDNNGVSVKAGNGINVDSSGVSVKTGSGINIDNNGISIKAGNGINVDNNGVSVKAGKGIKINADGISIDPHKVFSKGMIMMFSGSAVPPGWAFCDGTNETPDLRDRFISGAATLNDINGTNGKSMTGNNNEKVFNVQTSGNKTNLTISVKEIASAMEPRHIEGKAIENTHASESGKKSASNTEKNRQNSNNQTVYSVNEKSHLHTVNVVPPYYILAFIMKI
ncbi:tail fiber protein [Photorhabdus namnaonensis]|uniref:Adenoviral fiber protein (Repeat/shaft region) n=1 Tax=Photorhabdus namnaonensis TaxID=1851568 RepID=A0A1B8YGR2_9GAMM|nr:tail fiber protein [Photorhabdus namnaonensis]OCA54343.1 Adenoviral fiber protein (repeat/shaft region) [Photorhabdus namnaonensis]